MSVPIRVVTPCRDPAGVVVIRGFKHCKLEERLADEPVLLQFGYLMLLAFDRANVPVYFEQVACWTRSIFREMPVNATLKHHS